MSGFLGSDAWFVFGPLVAALGTVALAGYLRRHRGRPGADWLLGSLLAQAVFCLLAGVAPLTADRTLRAVLEVGAWVALTWVGLLFFAFALSYTGHSSAVRGWTGVAVAVTGVGSTLAVLTAPFHGFVWQSFRVDPSGTTVSYAVQPLGLVAVASGVALAGVGVLLLVDAVVSYGPLYRGEAAAVAVSTLPPTAGIVAWLTTSGSTATLQLVAVLFVPHVLFDIYAFVGSDMFETNPTTRRAADRTALDDVGTPMLVLDPDGRVVDYNAAADPLLDDGATDLLGTPVSTLLDVDPTATDGGASGAGGQPDEVVTARADGRRREFLVSRSTLTDPAGTVVGTTVVLQDVTRERRRQQRLDVLNRVLRHNLRNKMTAVVGNARLLREQADDEDVTDIAATIDDSASDLIDVGEKARAFERSRSGGPRYREVDPSAVVADTVEDSLDSDRVSVDATDVDPVVTDPELLGLVVEHLVENALVHTDAAVGVAAATDDGGLTLTVRDHGPRIPESELEPMRAGRETPLSHSAGIGLWVVQWSVTSLGGEWSVDADDGTTVTVDLPTGGADAAATD